MDTEMPGNEIAVFALTGGGAGLAREVAGKTGARLYLPARLKDNQKEDAVFFEDFAGEVKKEFARSRGLIFVMATGIVVRTIAPLLESKYVDPAVVVMDEGGSFAISLVSGHVGGANELARQVSRVTGAVPVITTATDVGNKPAVDVFAEKLDCVPAPASQVKEFNRVLAEGGRVCISSSWTLPGELNSYLASDDTAKDRRQVVITREPGEFNENILYLLPKNLVVGVGCRKGVPGDLIRRAVEIALEGIPQGLKRVKALATADIKEEELGIFEVARELNVPVKITDREEIRNLTENYGESEFVKKTIGVGGVCEPTAILASNRGSLVVPKKKAGPVTAAVAEEKLWWWESGPGTGNA